MKLSIKLDAPERDISRSWELDMPADGYIMDLIWALDAAVSEFQLNNLNLVEDRIGSKK